MLMRLEAQYERLNCGRHVFATIAREFSFDILASLTKRELGISGIASINRNGARIHCVIENASKRADYIEGDCR